MSYIDVHDEHARFVALDAYHRFVRTCATIDRRREAMAQLGYSDRMAVFTEVGPSVVPRTIREAVGATVSMVVSLLEIDRPEVHWFRPETANERAHRLPYSDGMDDLGQFEAPDNLDGRAIRSSPAALWVRADLPLRRAMCVAAHECRHLAQPNPDGIDGYVANEHDARAYEAAFAAAYLNRRN